jgi:hypothetical protein
MTDYKKHTHTQTRERKGGHSRRVVLLSDLVLQNLPISCHIVRYHPPQKERTGGAAAKVGQIPTDSRGIQDDFDFLSYEFRQAVQDARQLGLPVVNEDFKRAKSLKVSFSLAPEHMSRMPPSAAMVEIKELDSLNRTHAVSNCDTFVQKLPPPPEQSGRRELQMDSDTCRVMRKNLTHHTIQLDMESMRSLLPERWADSAALNAGMHLLQEFYPLKKTLWMNSAQVDFDWDELAKTPSCYRQVASCLFLDAHWTFGFIDHDTCEIWYLNSDIVDKNVPKIQTDPIARLFPNYQLYVIPCVKQCDSSSCGIYCLWWFYAILFRRWLLLKISCTDIRKFRTLMRRWILRSYFVSRLY